MSRCRDVKNCHSLLSTLEYIENRRVEASCIEDWGFTGFEPYLVQMIAVPGLLYEIDEQLLVIVGASQSVAAAHIEPSDLRSPKKSTKVEI